MREQTAGFSFQLPIAVCLALSLATIANPQLNAATFYVSDSGDDANDGSSWSDAFRTIDKAARVIQGGELVYVGAGTYTDDIHVDGVQLSSKTRFIASSGAIVSGQWNVFNSNNVTIDGFTFQGTTRRFLVWHGSYEGTLQNCTFSAGNEGLLIKDGSLTIDNCLVQDFTHDGIQVDGESRLLIRNSTISGCQESGLEVRKVANVVLDNCDVTGHSGDGIEVNVVADEIDPGTVPGSWTGHSVPLFGSDGPVSFGGSGHVHGDLHSRPQYPVNGSNVSGTIHDLGTTFPPVDASTAATSNDNGSIPLTDKGNDPLNGSGEFFLASNDGVDLPPGTYYFTDLETKPGSELRVSGATVVCVNGNILIKGSVNNTTLNPINFRLMVTGTSVEIMAQADVYAAIYAPAATLKLRGEADIHGMIIGDQLDIAGSVQIYPETSLEALAESLIPAPSSTSSPSPPSTWTSVSSGELDISGSTFTGNRYGVRLVTGQSFNSRYTDYSSNTEWGLYLKGSLDVENCTNSNNGVGGIWLNGIQSGNLDFADMTITDNSQYGIYLESCSVTFDGTMLPADSISGSECALTVVGGSLTLNGVSISGATVAGVDCLGGTLSVANSTLSGNTNGVTASNSALTLDGVTLTGNSSCGVNAVSGTLAVSNSTVAGSSDGISSNSCVFVTVDSCTLSGNNVGLNAHQNSSLVVTGSTLTGNTVWGTAVEPSGTAGLSVTFDACTIHSNGGGISVSNAYDGKVSLLSGTVIRDNTITGLHFVDCNLTVNDQLGGAAWSTLRNHYGISSTRSTLVLDGVVVTESSSYAIHTTNCDLTVRNSSLTGRDGIYAVNNSSTTVDASQLTSTVSGVTSWGIHRREGDVLVRNCLLNGFDNGIYLETASFPTAKIVNNTIVNVTTDGVYVADGPAEVVNTIVAGNNGQYGIVDQGSQLTHSYNLIYGVSNTFSGTTSAAGEVFQTPRFADAAAGDFSLGIGSPAINAGLDQGIDVPTDIAGNARPLFHAFDIGAYEYPSDNASFRILNWKEQE